MGKWPLPGVENPRGRRNPLDEKLMEGMEVK
jgi:hypothetical protein